LARHRQVFSIPRRGHQSLMSDKSRIPQLDGLRGFAILIVVLTHYFYNPDPGLSKPMFHLQSFFSMGWTGVDLFFVLSGFLIGGILLGARDSPRYFRTFYARRFYRIIPVYYLWILSFALLLLIGGPFLEAHTRSGILPRLDWWFFAHILFLQNMWTVNYVTLAIWWFSHTWSLAVEEQFYLVAPLLVWLLPKKRLTAVLLSVMAAAPLCRVLVRSLVDSPAWPAYRLMPCRADALALGMLCAIFWRDAKFREWLSAKKRHLYAALSIFFAGTLILGIWFSNPNETLMQTVGYSWLAFFYALLLTVVLVDADGLIARIARMGWLRELGRVSYCLYIVHPAVGYFCFGFLLHDIIHFTGLRSGAVGLLAIALSYGVARISWIFFEQPLLRLGHLHKY